MLKIQIKEPSTQTGSICVSWYVDPKLLQLLDGLCVEKPYVLLITAPTGDRYDIGKEQRTLAPLKDGMSYVSFATDGENVIHAVVVWDYKQDEKELKRIVLRKYCREWNRELLDYNGEKIDSRWREYWGIIDVEEQDSRFKQYATDSLNVPVPAGCFAKPAPAWEQPWVNLWFQEPPINECEYDKRRLWAYSIQPPIMFLNWILRVSLTLIALLSGFRQINWTPVFHLLSNGISETLENFKNPNYFWPKSWGKTTLGSCARMQLVTLSPPFLLSIIGSIWFFERTDLKTSLFLTAEFYGKLFATTACLFFIGLILWSIIKTMRKVIKPKSTSPSHRIPAQRDYMRPENVEFLSSHKGPRTYSTLPRQRKTVQLWFKDTKARRCKPFAR
ncbi:TPA: hypothetical protein DCW61_04025 [Candidatus Uhrbacteria bacterium]|nr:hypothetical protein [Candidatus Uhrbacteria bacterium]